MSNRSCCVVNCKNTSRKSQCKFYKFPTAKWKVSQRNMWIAAVRRQNVDGSPWVPKPYDYICSDHFVGGKKSETECSPSYIPTIFPSVYKSRKVNESSAINRYKRFMDRRMKKILPSTLNHESVEKMTENPLATNRPTSPEIEVKDEPLDIKDDPIPGTSGTNHLEPVDVNVKPSGINKNLAPFELQFDDNNSSKCNYEKIIKSELIDPSDTNHNQEESEISSTSIEHPTEHSVPPVNTLFETIKVEPDTEQFINENSDPLNYNKNKVTSYSNQNDLKTCRTNFAAFGKKLAEQLELFPVDYALILQEKIENFIIKEKQKLLLI